MLKRCIRRRRMPKCYAKYSLFLLSRDYLVVWATMMENECFMYHLNIRDKTTIIKCNLLFFFNMQLKSGRGSGLTCMTFRKSPYLTCSRKGSLSFITTVPFYHFFASHSRIVWILFYLETSSLEPFLLFYDLIASYYTKGKWQ